MADYIDLEYSMEPDQFSTLKVVLDGDAVKQSIIDILLTVVGERGEFEPTYGSRLYYILFEKMNQITAIQIQDEIKSALRKWEPRIRVYRVDVVPIQEKYMWDVTIHYEVLKLSNMDQLNLQLEKL